MKKKILLMTISIFMIITGVLAGCGSSSSESSKSTEKEKQAESTAGEETETAASEVTKLIGLADFVPHSELIEFVEPQLEA